MKYFKNTELAKLYHVSEKSVRNWIDASRQGRSSLQLYQHNDKFFVANTPQNSLLIQDLVERGKKYKNTRGLKIVSPLPRFYDIYDSKQIFDIISSITIHHEIPLKYSYLDGGAEFWDKYAQRLMEDQAPNTLTATIKLLKQSMNDLDRLLESGRKVNIIDLGPGNGLPVKDLLDHFIEQGRLSRYIGIDVSREILQITERRVKDWFGTRVPFEGYVRDFSTERFDDIFAEDYAGNDEDIPINLVLLLSGTICNFRSPDQTLQTICNSLGPDDLLLYTTKLDTPDTRRYFDLGIKSQPRVQDFLFKSTLELLNLDESLYELDQIFDEQKRARSISIRPLVDLSIEFKLSKGIRTIQMNRNEPILLWRYWHFNGLEVINQFDRSGFDLMHATKSLNQDYLLLVSKIKTDG